MARRDKINYYLDIAEVVGERSTCLRRRYGAVLVSSDRIVSTGFNGSPRGRKNCCDEGVCYRKKLGVPSGERYELCRSIHAEANCILSANREDMAGATLYLAAMSAESGELVPNTEPCLMCKRLIINAGISSVIVRETRDTYRCFDTVKWVEQDDFSEVMPRGYSG
ncbi:MAG: dCMP deaminase family protein [Oscillospiraceae bacterium]|jgi:dCMP deaminase|nr:dCMP deaminase family protein [Oscillospiraceae bacterium]